MIYSKDLLIKKSRNLLFWSFCACIPILFFLQKMEIAGGGENELDILIFPALIFILCGMYVLYKRKIDFVNKQTSKPIYLISEIMISIITLLTALSIGFELLFVKFEWRILTFALIYSFFSALIFYADMKELKMIEKNKSTHVH